MIPAKTKIEVHTPEYTLDGIITEDIYDLDGSIHILDDAKNVTVQGHLFTSDWNGNTLILEA